MIKDGSWLSDIVQAYNQLGGIAKYSDVYALVKKVRLARGASWTMASEEAIRKEVEVNSPDSGNFMGRRRVFYSVKGLGKGVWGLLPEYDSTTQNAEKSETILEVAYLEGLEGILRETHYLRGSRDRHLVESRKLRDDFRCQACGYRKNVGAEKYIIDVHHLNPIGSVSDIKLTSVDDLICLCPNCHRIAYSRTSTPLSIAEIKHVLKSE